MLERFTVNDYDCDVSTNLHLSSNMSNTNSNHCNCPQSRDDVEITWWKGQNKSSKSRSHWLTDHWLMSRYTKLLLLLIGCKQLDVVTRRRYEELGVQPPVGFWDPAGLSKDGDVEVQWDSRNLVVDLFADTAGIPSVFDFRFAEFQLQETGTSRTRQDQGWLISANGSKPSTSQPNCFTLMSVSGIPASPVSRAETWKEMGKKCP